MTRIGLVLGAGGITGFAYHSGALSALRRATGWDPRTADVIVGTSAGAGFGAILRGGVAAEEVMAHLLAAPSDPETMARLRALSGRDGRSAVGAWPGPTAPTLAARELVRPWRLRPGRVRAALLPAGRVPTRLVGDRVRELHGLEWPASSYWACAVRLDDGDRVVFGLQRLDVDVGTAIEASCAIPGFFHPVEIDGTLHVDGVVHSPTNADLLVDTDVDLVVVLSPMSATCRDAARTLDVARRVRSGLALRREVDLLRRHGHEVLVLQPGRADLRVMGSFDMDPTRMIPTVLRAGTSTLRRLAEDTTVRSGLDLLRAAA